MKIADNCVVSIHYTLVDSDGNQIDSSIGAAPLNYIHGASNIIPGLENALEGLEIGAKLNVTVQPEEGYGKVEPGLIQKLPLDAFDGFDDIEVGTRFQVQGEYGNVIEATVVKIEDDGITIDGNNELAGKVLHFAVSIEAVREATADEIAHGLVH